jgi:hypothetical protein
MPYLDSGAARATAVALCLLVSSCATLERAITQPTAPPKPPPVPEAFRDKCEAGKGQPRPLVVEWSAADRAALEAQARAGQLVVHREGCELEILRRCKAPAKRVYAYAAITPKEERAVIKSAEELYANIPVHAAKLEGKLAERGELRAEMTIVGEWAVPGAAPAVDQLEGACEGATHVVTALTVGAFSFQAGASSEKGAAASVLGFGAGVSRSDSNESLSKDGDASACAASHRGDGAPPERCGALLRLELAPLLEAGTGIPDCKPGTVLVGKACKPVEKPEALAPDDAKFVDEKKGFGWSNRCFLHFRAGALPYARAACKRGLDAGPDDQTKGALFFNWALVEEATGDPLGACRMLGQSMAVRPNKVVEQKAEKMKCAELLKGN